MKYLFGPVNSRRLGLSLGVDLVPAKICSFDCIYCEIGPTTALTVKRGEYSPTAAIIAELEEYFVALEAGHSGLVTPQVITLTASGEPTLHSGIARVIAYLKGRTEIPVVVLTNGSLLDDPQVRLDLMGADIVVPSLDAVRPESFAQVNKPAGSCGDPQKLLEGLISFTEEFGGSVWLEILLVEGINDSEADIVALVEAVAQIKPERIQLNTVVRPPALAMARPLSSARLQEIAGRFGDIPVEVVGNFVSQGSPVGERTAEEIRAMLQRRPCTLEDVRQALGLSEETVARLIGELVGAGKIGETIHDGRKYYQVNKPEKI
ncbi:MAG: radical SAM protein [Desulfobulbaceae bacterium]|nr:radical SAM protein [Desulfobulbaceae bacterium]